MTDRIKSDEFMCSICSKTFDKGRSDEEARQEEEQLFGARDPNAEVVCEDCFNKVMSQPDCPTPEEMERLKVDSVGLSREQLKNEADKGLEELRRRINKKGEANDRLIFL